MNLGHKHYRNQSTLGVKNYSPLSMLGHKAPHAGTMNSNFSTPNVSGGIHNVSNSNMSAREPIVGLPYKRHQERHMHIEKSKPISRENGKFA